MEVLIFKVCFPEYVHLRVDWGFKFHVLNCILDKEGSNNIQDKLVMLLSHISSSQTHISIGGSLVNQSEHALTM